MCHKFFVILYLLQFYLYIFTFCKNSWVVQIHYHYNQHVHELFYIFTINSWTVHEPAVITVTWSDREQFMNSVTWSDHKQFLNRQFMNCSWTDSSWKIWPFNVHALFMNCSWFFSWTVHEQRSWTLSEQIMNCSWTVHKHLTGVQVLPHPSPSQVEVYILS